MEPGFERKQATQTNTPVSAPTQTEAPAATVADSISRDHKQIGVMIRTIPDSVPSLLQFVITSRRELVEIIVEGMRAEFRRTGGVGPTVDRMFTATLALQGPASAQVRQHMEGLIATRDREAQGLAAGTLGRQPRSLDGKDKLLQLADRDPAAGQLYAKFFAAPKSAAAPLQAEAKT